MAAPGRIQVVIHGRTYNLAGADPDHTRSLARKVDEAMTRFSDAMPGAESYQLAILAALHLADELSAVQGRYEGFRATVRAKVGRILEASERPLAETGDGDEPDEGPVGASSG